MRVSILVFLAPAALAADYVAVEPGTDVPDGWTIMGPTQRGRSIELTFAVKQQNLAALPHCHWSTMSRGAPDVCRFVSSACCRLASAMYVCN